MNTVDLVRSDYFFYAEKQNRLSYFQNRNLTCSSADLFKFFYSNGHTMM